MQAKKDKEESVAAKGEQPTSPRCRFRSFCRCTPLPANAWLPGSKDPAGEVRGSAAAAEAKKRPTMKDKTKDKRAKGQAGISDTAKGYWKSEQVSDV